MTKRILAIIVTYNGMEWLPRCLGSVFSSTVKPDVFVFDNSSTDGGADYIEKNFPEVHLVRSDKNLGFAKANNVGLRYALEKGNDFVYLLNQDAWVMEDTFEKLVSAFSESKWGLISPKQMRPDLTTPDRRFIKHYHGPMDGTDDVQSVRFVMAAHWMISSKCLRKVGLFSPAFKHYGEDNNFCDRVRFHGFKIGVLPSAMAVHDRQTRKRTKEQRVYLNCQYSRVRLSDPEAFFCFQYVWQPLRLCIMALWFFSMLPIKNITGLINDYPSLKKWREISMKKGAFI